MGNSVLVTGLGVGYELGVCGACNSNFYWLIDNPSILIWTDKIYITKRIWEDINDDTRREEWTKFDNAIKLIMNILDDYGMIEVIDPLDIFEKSFGDIIEEQVHNDQLAMIENYSHISLGDKNVPGEMYINDLHYCSPYIASMYVSMSLANHLDSSCLFDERDMNYMNHKFGLQIPNVSNAKYNKAFSEVFSIVLPDELVLHNFAFENFEKCETCMKLDECGEKYLFEIEENTKKMLKWREYDSIYQARDVIDNLARIKGDIRTDKDINDVIAMFDKKVRKINTTVNKRFPRIKRWTNLAAMVSVPVALGTLMTGNIELSVASASITGMSKVADEFMKYYAEKNNWIGFINK